MQWFLELGGGVMRSSVMLCLLGSVLWGMGASGRLDGGDWPQWRGMNRDGMVEGAAWPESLGSNVLKEAWSVPLGPSYSGPVVVGKRVFTTQTRDEKWESVLALDRETGRELWKAEWEGAIKVPFFAKANGDWIRATPASDGESLYVAGIRDVLASFDVATGREKWRKDFVKEYESPVPEFGFVSSPLLDGDSVYVQAGGALVRLKKDDGTVMWRSLQDGGGMWGNAFSSPVMGVLAGQRQLVVLTREKLCGVDPADGKVLWSQNIEAFRGMNILTPILWKDHVFTSAYGGKTQLYKVESSGGSGDARKWETRMVWEGKWQGYMSTPVILGDVAYHHLRSQRVMAIDLATGKELWTSEKSYGKYWSWVAHSGKSEGPMLGLDERGLLFLVKGNREKMDVVAQRRMAPGDTWGHLAVTGDELWIRELRRLVKYRWIPQP